MKKIIYISFLLLILVGLMAGAYFKDTLFGLYDNTIKNLPQFDRTHLQDTLNEIKKDILAPPPLNVGGQDRGVILTKAKIIAQTNIQRFDNGLMPPLSENAQLNAAALVKANDILAKQYFEHVSPTGIDPGTLVKNAGYDYIVSGENLILGNFKDEAEVVQRWMDSPGHRANILNDRFSEIGVAVVKGVYEGHTVWVGVQEFGLPLSNCPEPNKTQKSQIEVNKTQLDFLSSQIDAKRAEIDKTSRNSPKYNQLVDEYNELIAEYNQLNQTTKNFIIDYNNQVNAFNACVAGQ